MRIEDKIIFNEIKKGNKLVYEALFSDYYDHLVRFADSYTFDQHASEDIVQNLYLYIWENAKKIDIHTSIKAYFYQSLKNRCLNYLRNLKMKDKKNIIYVEALLNSKDDTMFFDPEILDQIKKTIDKLPPQMTKIFKLKHIEGLKQTEIADQMNISVNTVKTQLKRAKVKLRDSLFSKTNLIFFL
jgi:RNA polymerase sigma-70 factor (ECF subfamily)